MSQNPDIPSFNINGVHLKRAPTNTLSQEPKTNEEEVLQEWSTPYLKSDRFDKKKNLQGCRPYVAIADYLDKHGVSFLDSDKEIQKCWPPELLEYHFDISVVRQLIEDLVEHDELPASEPRSSEAKNIDPITLWIRRLFPDYRLILFILTVMEVPKFIHYFFEDGITDACLPLRKGGLRGKSLVHNDKEICGGCPWRRSDVADFVQRYQWRANITVIDTTLNLEAPKYTLDRLSVRPWVETEQPFPNSKFSSTTAAGRTSSAKTYGGSEGHVRRVLMHPMMYKSRSPNKSIQEEGENTRVCRKVLPGRKREIFNREVEMLRWFGRNKHAHLIQVLATISYGEDEHCLLFPWADGDLVTYFQTHETAPREDSFLKWVSAQIYGLADAVRYIHDPKCLNDKGEELFGRHGDIKPENILWFRNRGDPKYGSLVLSDLGITAINRLGTRSYLPHEKVFGWSPGYEPPELHIAGDDGKISRSYDIWSLGCVFLEFLVWYLGGWKGGFKQLLLDRMEEPSPNNIGSDNFYGVSWMEDGKYVFGIKNTISKKFREIHTLPVCPGFVHDAADLIEKYMLVAQSKTPPVTRITAEALVRKLDKICEAFVIGGHCNERCRDRAPCPPVRGDLSEYGKTRHSARGTPEPDRIYHGPTREQ